MNELPNASQPRTRAIGWTVLVLGYAVVALVAVGALHPPAPSGIDAPPDQFSEARARESLRALTSLGIRANGTPSHERAVHLLVDQLRAIPGLEVDVQRARNVRTYEGTAFQYPTFVYRVANVVARLPGRSRNAILLDAHFDTFGDSYGAGDDGVGVAAMIETIRALSVRGSRERSYIVLLNGGEEGGLFGADGFARGHPWARDVRAYLYIDGSAGGRASLIVAGPRNGWLIDDYADFAPRPAATVINQDLMDGNVLAHDGDFRPFRDRGMVGLSMAAVGDMWSTHTARDRYERVEPGTLQHLGDTTLALARRLGERPIPATDDPSRRVYFDLLGRVMVHYSLGTARVLGCASLAMALAAIVWLMRARRLTGRQLAASIAWSALGIVSGLLAALFVGIVLAFVIRRPHGWYAAPVLLAPAFGAAAIAGLLGVHSRWRSRWLRKDPRGGAEALVWASWAGALVGWSVWLLLATLRNVGAGYLPLSFVLPLAVGLLAAQRWTRWRLAIGMLSLGPGAVVMMSLAAPLMRAMVPEIGFLPLPIPGDPLVAVFTAVFTLATAGAAMWTVHDLGGPGRATLVTSVIALVGIVGCAVRFPWTAERPRRVMVTHIEQDGRSALLMGPMDALPMRGALAAVGDARPVRAGWARNVFMPRYTHEVPARPPAFGAPRAEVTTVGHDASSGTRTVELRLHAETPQVRLYIPRARLAGWSLSERLPERPADPGDLPGPEDDCDVIHFEGFTDEGETVRLRVRGDAPFEVDLRAVTPVPDAEIDALMRRMPSWVVAWPGVTRVVRLVI